MELVENMSISISSHKEEEDDIPLPGFRFHPTDEELLGFYLKRKVEKKPISIDLIKQADIYKYDPWDLPKSGNVGDKEWYFFCKRGRKYRNSIRPNRVTGSGFWKATGIDRPIYSSGREAHDCIGLKKSLVYYRGSAGKGTKTDWMMHEFRFPATHDKSPKDMDDQSIAQEAEVWTLCRIFKRNVSNYRKCIPDLREMAAKKTASVTPLIDQSSLESSDQNMASSYISFSATVMDQMIEKNHYSTESTLLINNSHQQFFSSQISAAASSYSNMNELLRHSDWEDLRSIVDNTVANYNPFYL